jgi:hypothetical protein
MADPYSALKPRGVEPEHSFFFQCHVNNFRLTTSVFCIKDIGSLSFIGSEYLQKYGAHGPNWTGKKRGICASCLDDQLLVNFPAQPLQALFRLLRMEKILVIKSSTLTTGQHRTFIDIFLAVYALHLRL